MTPPSLPLQPIQQLDSSFLNRCRHTVAAHNKRLLPAHMLGDIYYGVGKTVGVRSVTVLLFIKEKLLMMKDPGDIDDEGFRCY